MTTVPDPKTWVNLETPDWHEFKTEVFDTLDFLLNSPMCHVVATSATTINNNSVATVSFNEVVMDTEQMWDSALPSRISPNTPGRYKVIFGGSFLGGTANSGIRLVQPALNGSAVLEGRRDDRSGTDVDAYKVMQGLTTTVAMNGTTDYLELQLYQNSGTNTTSDATTILARPRMYLRWVGTW